MNDGQPSGASPSWRNCLASGCLVALMLAVLGTGGGVLVAWLLDSPKAPPAATRQAQPAPPSTRTATPAPLPTGEPGTPTLAASGDSESVYCYLIFEWPGPPREALAVSLPPPVTDQEQLERAQRVYRQGKTAFDAEKWEEAIERFDRALELDPRHAEAYNLRGRAYTLVGPRNDLDARLDNAELAILDYTRAIAARPDWGNPYNHRGLCYHLRAQVEPLREARREWLELALADQTQAVELLGDRTQANCARASLYIDLWDRDRVLREALLCPCDGYGCLYHIQRAYRLAGNHEQALRVLDEWETYRPDNPALHSERGKYYMEQGQYEQALAEFRLAAEKYEGSFVPGTILDDQAAAEYHLGHLGKAEQLIVQARPYTWIDWGQPYYYLGMIWLEEGETEAAVEALLWAEMTLSEGDPLLEATRAELEKLPLPDQAGGGQVS